MQIRFSYRPASENKKWKIRGNQSHSFTFQKKLLRVSVKDLAVAVMILKLPHWAFLNHMHSLLRDGEGEVEISTKSTLQLQQFSFDGVSHYFYLQASLWHSDLPRIMPTMQLKDKDEYAQKDIFQIVLSSLLQGRLLLQISIRKNTHSRGCWLALAGHCKNAL